MDKMRVEFCFRLKGKSCFYDALFSAMCDKDISDRAPTNSAI